MINENIKKYRKLKGITQEELAVRLGVVRQTVSKWETGMSVPDAEILLKMAEVLGTSADKLLGTETKDNHTGNLAEELVRLNEELAEKNRREVLMKRANEKRGVILFLSFAAMLISLIVESEIISILLAGICILSAVTVLYRNLALLTSISTEDMRIKTLRVTTLFNIAVLIVMTGMTVLVGAGVIRFTENQEKMCAMFLISAVILFGGIVSPKLPFTRHTGLRLPWTVRDEETWYLAHRIIGYISLPAVLLYIACVWTVDRFEMVTMGVMLVWIGVPAVMSYVFYRKKWK